MTTTPISTAPASPTLGTLRGRDGRYVVVKPTTEDPCVFRVRHASESLKLRRGLYVRCAGGAMSLDDAASRAIMALESASSFFTSEHSDEFVTLIQPTDLEVRCNGAWLPYEDFIEAISLVERVRKNCPQLVARFLPPAA